MRAVRARPRKAGTATRTHPGAHAGAHPRADDGPGAGTVDDLLARPGRSLDGLFRGSPPGDVPVGAGEGTVLLVPGTPLAAPLARLTRAVGWKGKVFDPARRQVVNRLGPWGVPAVRAAVHVGPSRLDERDSVVLDYARTSVVARWVWDEIRLVAPGTYLGIAWFRGHRVAYFVLRFADGG